MHLVLHLTNCATITAAGAPAGAIGATPVKVPSPSISSMTFSPADEGSG